MDRDEFKAGETLSAGELNAIKAELLRLAKVIAAPPLHVIDGADGMYFKLDLPATFPIKIQSGGSGGAYPWVRQNPTSGGTWADDTQTGTLALDPAYEVNHNATIATGTIILRAYRIPETGELRFERGTC